MPQSDEQHVRACLNGHPEAFRHLVERYQTPMMRYLYGCTDSVDQAEEVAQEAFVRAYFALPKLKKPESFFSWLFGIADRVAKESHRVARRLKAVDLNELEPAELTGRNRGGSDSVVSEAVSKLPDIYREVIVLRFYWGQSCDEISCDLGVPLGTVTKRLSRAYGLLRERLQNLNSTRESEAQ